MGIEAASQTPATREFNMGVFGVIMKKVWSWLLGILVAAPIVFLFALFALVILSAGFFILWILYQ